MLRVYADTYLPEVSDAYFDKRPYMSRVGAEDITTDRPI